jgi:hypothetical protein
MIFIGGSSMGCGLDSPMVREQLGYAPINMGLHGRLGATFMINEVKDLFRPDPAPDRSAKTPASRTRNPVALVSDPCSGAPSPEPLQPGIPMLPGNKGIVQSEQLHEIFLSGCVHGL